MSALTAYASGVNEAREIHGFARAGVPLGASASNLRQDAIQALLRLDGPVFLDSGAFSEVSFSTETRRFEISKPISPREWRRRLSIYLLVARKLGRRLSCVAPDCVGSQEETLRRLALYRDDLRELHQLGAQILIPLQVGTLTHEAFYAEAQAVAGVPLIPAFTMKKAATSDADAKRFLKAVQPQRIHLLGLGRQNRRAGQVVSMIRQCSPETEITMDSNRLRAVTGKARPMTALEHALRESSAENLFNEVDSPVLASLGCRIDYTDSIARPSEWADQETLRVIAVSAGLTLSESHSFLGDPDGFLSRNLPDSEISYWEHPVVSAAIDSAWAKYVNREIQSHVRTAAIYQTFRQEASCLA